MPPRSLTPAGVDSLSIITPLAANVNLDTMKQQLPAYMAAASAAAPVSHDDVDIFTNEILGFWRQTSATELLEWRKAAQVVFALTPNSASCERVFSLVKVLFGDRQLSTISDTLQSSLLLRYNKQ
eukprot:6181752-Pleurochrysis_carterae.AAC.1